MFKKKEHNMTYFFGGTAVGMAAGLLVGKLLSNTSTIKSQSVEPKTSQKGNVTRYSQDDNIHNPYFHKTKNSSCIRSKSTSRCEDKSCKEQSVSVPLSIKLNNNFTDNINYHVSEEKYSTNVQKISYNNNNNNNNNNNQLHNLSIEDNASYNSSNETSSYYKEKKYNNRHLSESKNIEKECLSIVQSEDRSLTNMENNSETMNIESIINFDKKDILNM